MSISQTKPIAALPAPKNQFPPDSAVAALRTLLASLDVEGLPGDHTQARFAAPVCVVPNMAGRGLALTGCNAKGEPENNYAGPHLRIYASGQIVFVGEDGGEVLAR